MDRLSNVSNDDNIETTLIIGGVVIVVMVAILMIAHYFRKRGKKGMGCRCKCDCQYCQNCPYRHMRDKHRDMCGKCGGIRINKEREQVCMQTKDGIVCWD